MRQYAVGVDIGGTTVKTGIFDAEGMLLAKWEMPTVTREGTGAFFAGIADRVRKELDQRQISASDMIGVGMGVPAAVTADGHMARAVNLGLDSMYPAKELSKYLKDIPVKATNDANAAALGEKWKGAAKGYGNVVMVTLGTGVGGGIIAENAIISGAAGGGGEIGHIRVEDRETIPCSCGNKGCLEQYASATGIVRIAAKRLEGSRRESVLKGAGLTAKSIFDAAKEQDGMALKIVEEFGQYLAKGLGILCTVVNPEIVVIGGGVSKAGTIVIDAIKPYFKQYVFPACSGVDFRLAKLGNDAGIYGAAGLFLDGIEPPTK